MLPRKSDSRLARVAAPAHRRPQPGPRGRPPGAPAQRGHAGPGRQAEPAPEPTPRATTPAEHAHPQTNGAPAPHMRTPIPWSTRRWDTGSAPVPPAASHLPGSPSTLQNGRGGGPNAPRRTGSMDRVADRCPVGRPERRRVPPALPAPANRNGPSIGSLPPAANTKLAINPPVNPIAAY